MGEEKQIHDEKTAALFANLVMQQANGALMFMGKVKHPESGESMKDLEAARFFVDLLEMLETKTKGNLGPEEEALLKQSLMTVRMAFVEAASESAPGGQPSASEAKKPEPATAQKSEPATVETTAGDDADAKKKFVKKY
jgi:hypothetical protein